MKKLYIFLIFTSIFMFFLTGENVFILLYNKNMREKRRTKSIDFGPSLLNYNRK